MSPDDQEKVFAAVRYITPVLPEIDNFMGRAPMAQKIWTKAKSKGKEPVKSQVKPLLAQLQKVVALGPKVTKGFEALIAETSKEKLTKDYATPKEYRAEAIRHLEPAKAFDLEVSRLLLAMDKLGDDLPGLEDTSVKVLAITAKHYNKAYIALKVNMNKL